MVKTKIRLIEKTFKDRSKILWLSEETNEKLKKIKSDKNFAAIEDVLVFLLAVYNKVQENVV
ncbi:MAG: hypothetical protein QXL94_02220 [Candidatus Parvarchaeum sp.]